MSPSSPAEWDDALVEWKNDPEQEVPRHDFTYAVAAVKFFFPSLRRALPWAQAVQDGWERTVEVRHTVPLPKLMAKFLAVHMASRGRARMGLALVVQTHCGLRPSELLNLKTEHISFPMADGGSLQERPVFLALGRGTATGHTPFAQGLGRLGGSPRGGATHRAWGAHFRLLDVGLSQRDCCSRRLASDRSGVGAPLSQGWFRYGRGGAGRVLGRDSVHRSVGGGGLVEALHRSSGGRPYSSGCSRRRMGGCAFVVCALVVLVLPGLAAPGGAGSPGGVRGRRCAFWLSPRRGSL